MSEIEKFSVCRRCGNKIKGDRPNCPECSGPMDLMGYAEEKISFTDSHKAEQEYDKKNPWVISIVVIIAVVSAFLGLFIAGPIGVIVGLILGGFSYIISPFAVEKIKEIKHF